MKRTVIITARIRDDYAELIRSGTKTYEVRDEPFGDAQIIHYISQNEGTSLGTYSLEGQFSLGRDEDSKLISYAAISEEAFYELFPRATDGGPRCLWVARIGDQVDMEKLIGES